MSAAGATPGLTRRMRTAIPVPGPRVARRFAALAVVGLILLAGYLFWLRESSLVRVQQVTVTGLTATGTGSERIRSALISAAKGMTTLHADHRELERAVAGFPVVRGLEVDPDFPKAMRIHVLEHRPAALLAAGSRRVPVAADGTVLAGRSVPGNLPLVKTTGALPDRRVAPGAALGAVQVAGGLPAALQDRVDEVRSERGTGLVVPLEEGPKLIFGDAARVRAKWAAAVRVLADPDASGAAYIDVRIPERPAAGGLPVETVTPVAPAQAPAGAARAPVAPAVPSVSPEESPSAPAGTAPSGPGPPPAPVAPTQPTQRPAPAPAGEGGGAAPAPQP